MFLGSILLVLGVSGGFRSCWNPNLGVFSGILFCGFLWVCFVVLETLTLALLFCVFQSVWRTQSVNFNSNQL